MNDANIRKRLRAAIGDANYPAALTSRLAARLAEPAIEERRHTWVLAVVAAMLALALVITILFSTHAFRPQAFVPVNPPVGNVPATGTCPGYGQAYLFGNSDVPHPVRMASARTGWAAGGLRTTDGGAHWRDVSPTALRSDAPTPFDRKRYPPAFADFYLDANHAWEARGHSSATACFSAVEVFSTSDGGRSWESSGAIPLSLEPGWGISTQLFFLDSGTGWLWVREGAPGRNGIDMLSPTSISQGLLFRSEDGGRHWNLVSHLVASKLGIPASNTCPSPLRGDIDFSTRNNGWMSACQGSSPLLLSTRDGGASWRIQRVACSCGLEMPVFVDAPHGLVIGYNQDASTTLFATADGGATWRALRQPGSGYLLLVDQVDAGTIWALVTPPGWDKTSTAGYELYRSDDGGASWALVNGDVPLTWPPGYMQFVDSLHGFASNVNGADVLLVTTDGGNTWKSITPTISRAG